MINIFSESRTFMLTKYENFTLVKIQYSASEELF